MERSVIGDSDQVFPGKGHLTPEKEELYKLRNENKRLRMEHEILKTRSPGSVCRPVVPVDEHGLQGRLPY
jgi:hypothetical protein